ncbi:hypothetical protein WP1_237 [Pseudomonas phage WP1]
MAPFARSRFSRSRRVPPRMFWRGSCTPVIPLRLGDFRHQSDQAFRSGFAGGPGVESAFGVYEFLDVQRGMLYIFEASLMISLMYDGTVTGSALRCGEKYAIAKRLGADWLAEDLSGRAIFRLIMDRVRIDAGGPRSRRGASHGRPPDQFPPPRPAQAWRSSTAFANDDTAPSNMLIATAGIIGRLRGLVSQLL